MKVCDLKKYEGVRLEKPYEGVQLQKSYEGVRF